MFSVKKPTHNNFFAMIFGLVYKFIIGCVFGLIGLYPKLGFMQLRKTSQRINVMQQLTHDLLKNEINFEADAHILFLFLKLNLCEIYYLFEI